MIATVTAPPEKWPFPTTRIVIIGQPATKKNSQQWNHKPSVAFLRWQEGAMLQARVQWFRQRGGIIASPFTLRARIFRRDAKADLDNSLSAICDMLQTAEIITNDRLVAAFDGSRLYVDSIRPRVELDIIEGVLPVLA